MAKTIILHIMNEDPIMAEIEEMPEVNASYFVCSNLRKKDGKAVNYLTPGVKTVLFPWNRVTFIEIMVSVEERREVVDFFRDS